MHAAVFRGKADVPSLELVPVPRLREGTDALIRVLKTTICGTDLHILAGNVGDVPLGTILGHEGIGVVVEVGQDVRCLAVGDRVLVSCIVSCGSCAHCAQNRQAHCDGGGWVFGHHIDGMQAEYCRVPHADFTCHQLPAELAPLGGVEEDPYIMASDVLPTSYEIGLRSGQFPRREGMSIAVVGSGPLGLACIMSLVACQLPSDCRIFAIDLREGRLRRAEELGATDTYDNTDGNAAERVLQATGGEGVDFAIECIGTPVGWAICERIVRCYGEVSILGVHGQPVALNLQRMWDKNVSIHTGNVGGHSTQWFLEHIHQGRIDASKLISNTFRLREILHAYRWFHQNHDSLKVILYNDYHQLQSKL